MTKYFYDTSTLLEYGEEIINEENQIFICDIVLKELESIKTSRSKDEDTKIKAQQVISLLHKYSNNMVYIHYPIERLNWVIDDFQLERNHDAQILASVYITNKEIKEDNFVLYTNDFSLQSLGHYVMKVTTKEYKPKVKEIYDGVVPIEISDETLADFYAHFYDGDVGNYFNLLPNQYVALRSEGETLGIYKYTGEEYKQVFNSYFESDMFGRVTSKKGDFYQTCAMDSLKTNQVTAITGPAGSGKSLLSMAYLWHQLEKGKIDKIIIFANPIAARGAAKLGYYPGSREDKLMDSQIGNFLVAKLGSVVEVEKMLDEGTLMLLPLSDIRGMDTSGMRAAIYISEAQNLDANLLKLALQRVGEDCICILDGDTKSQVDSELYSGKNNGLKRMIEVFKGQKFFGWIDLKTIYRSKIAKIAEKM